MRKLRATPEGRAMLKAKAAAYAAAKPDVYKAIAKRAVAKRTADPERHAAYKLSWKASNDKRKRTPYHWGVAAVGRLRYRAAQRGIPFEMCVADLPLVEVCPALGVTLDYGKGGPWAASVDRLCPELGYVPGNVRIICKKANAMKNDGTLDEHRRLVAWMERELEPPTQHSEGII